jgi:hypothetical protein
MFKDPVNDLLGIPYGEDRFNYDYYLEVKSEMMQLLGHKPPQDAPIAETPSTPPQDVTGDGTPNPEVPENSAAPEKSNDDTPF